MEPPDQRGTLVLSYHTFKVEVHLSASRSIHLGPNLRVSGPKGSLTLVAGDQVAFDNGFSVETGGVLVVATGRHDFTAADPKPRRNGPARRESFHERQSPARD